MKTSTLIAAIPSPMKIAAGIFAAAPLVWALAGMGWAGYQAPGKIAAHIAQADSARHEQATADSALLSELRESNRLARCTIRFPSYQERLRCAVP